MSKKSWQAIIISAIILSLCLFIPAAIVVYHEHIEAFYYAIRLTFAEEDAVKEWGRKLEKMGPVAASSCRWAYRNSPPDGQWKHIAAESLSACAGLKALSDLASREDVGNPAEKVLVDFLTSVLSEFPEAPPPEAEVLYLDESPPPADLHVFETEEKLTFRYMLGTYEVEICRDWKRSFTVSYSSKTKKSTEQWGAWSLAGGHRVVVKRLMKQTEAKVVSDIYFCTH